MNWIIMPVVNNLEMTHAAIADCLDQTGVDPRVLVVGQGVDDALRQSLEGWAEREPRVLCWFHTPPLPSLSASWNRALEFVWACGGSEALVINNDVKMAPWTYTELLNILAKTAYFVSAVGVREEQYRAYLAEPHWIDTDARGGPDFSCFLLSKEGHAKYPFDESFIPAYCEDLDCHRRYMLGGDGARIFSVNLPYLHYASRTVNSYTPEQQQRFAQQVQGARDYYARKWGGAVNQERFTKPFGPTALAGITTPELQAAVQRGDALLYTLPVEHFEDVPPSERPPL